MTILGPRFLLLSHFVIRPNNKLEPNNIWPIHDSGESPPPLVVTGRRREAAEGENNGGQGREETRREGETRRKEEKGRRSDRVWLEIKMEAEFLKNSLGDV